MHRVALWPSGCVKSRSWINIKSRAPNVCRGPFYGEILKFWSPPGQPPSQPHLPAPFSPAMAEKIKIWPQSNLGCQKLFENVFLVFLHGGYRKLKALQNFYHFTLWRRFVIWKYNRNEPLQEKRFEGILSNRLNHVRHERALGEILMPSH